ncbi:cytochrome P450 [Guyanagaster necrorhizus]|uniref:Cytochrome P450 n=1 Tax=Guyanagaster necrorhizus TaxID=856835 RepID=A0A9P8AQS9_9AGAR|nr:cytochrome P450 [Guyanagaster necrorhizus MCA 3950]KAG7444663.1 cytochrome P450 [Guyanagaster necrorhizus MCA 3950]
MILSSKRSPRGMFPLMLYCRYLVFFPSCISIVMNPGSLFAISATFNIGTNLLALGMFLWVIIGIIRRRSSSSLPFPPGPKGYPIIGNMFDVPMEREWEAWAEWRKKYGDISSATVLNQTIVILNSYPLAKELLDGRSAKYSDRPYMSMPILCGWKDTLLILGYGRVFRTQRKLFHKSMGTMEIFHRFYYIEDEQSRKFLKRVLAEPEIFVQHIETAVASIVLLIAYGYTIGENDPLLAKCKQITEDFIRMTSHKFLVNKIPVLRHVPGWIPGANFQRLAKEWKQKVEELTDEPFHWVKEQMAKGTFKPSFVSTNLEDNDDEYSIKCTAVAIYGAGFDTTVVTIKVFFKMMALFPDVQARVQTEIDSVTGSNRLPTLADRDQGLLPYTLATLYEVFRWHLPLPTGFPHRTVEDDTYNGYFIPKGSIVAFNTLQMCHDPELYPNPDVFDPTRFLGVSPQLDPRELIFGFGRRACPGRFLAEASVFLTMARTLAVFNITNAVDMYGVPLKADPAQLTGAISDTPVFKCTIRPRSEKVASLIDEIL